jgi:exosortase/archaeosortase family protein
MTTARLAAAFAIYTIGLLAVRRARSSLVGYLWGAFGLAGILIFTGQLAEWDVPLGNLQGGLLVRIGRAFGSSFQMIGPATLLVPDPTGWSVLRIGIECSTLIEASVFAGLLLFYPRFPAQERALRLGAGLGATFLINLARLAVIIGLVMTLGKPVVPWAHAVIGRLVFFVGIVFVYWRMLTLPTLRLVRRDLEVSGRAVL